MSRAASPLPHRLRADAVRAEPQALQGACFSITPLLAIGA
jgi:hypothetical protein